MCDEHCLIDILFSFLQFYDSNSKLSVYQDTYIYTESLCTESKYSFRASGNKKKYVMRVLV